jgi:phosphatidylglycerol:prolipoprotein diacylglycerol transferase
MRNDESGKPRDSGDSSFIIHHSAFIIGSGDVPVHPDLFVIPGLNYPVRSWGLFVAIGILVGLAVTIRRARRRGLDPGFVTSLAILGLVLGVIGCRAMYLVHHEWDALRSGAIGLREIVAMSRGGEILGGVLLASIGAIVFLVATRRPVLAHLDVLLPPTLLAMGIGRIGCLLAGCCWGGLCETPEGHKALPWAVHFPYGSPALARDIETGRSELPPELYWQPPKSAERSPIPPDVLARARVDEQPELVPYAMLAARAGQAKSADPDGAEYRRLEAELRAAGARLGQQPTLMEVLAARHLGQLAEQGMPRKWADLRALASAQHSRWLHPTQIYDAVTLFLLFIVLSEIDRRGYAPGMVVAWTMILYSINRVLQEAIRGDNPRDVFGLTVSTFLSLVVLVAGVILAIALARRTVRPANTGGG